MKGLRGGMRQDGDDGLWPSLETLLLTHGHDAIDRGINGEISGELDITTRMPTRAGLRDDDLTSSDMLFYQGGRAM